MDDAMETEAIIRNLDAGINVPNVWKGIVIGNSDDDDTNVSLFYLLICFYKYKHQSFDIYKNTVYFYSFCHFAIDISITSLH